MGKNKYALGLDYGTNSCRSLLIDINDGSELASAVFNYPSGEMGILLDSKNPNLARQNPQDYVEGMIFIVREALKIANEKVKDFSHKNVIGIGIDTTGSTIIPVDKDGTPLAFDPKFKNNLNANVWLWKDHTSYQEAELITSLAAKTHPQYLAKCGGTYSSEWFWSKILHLKKIDPEVYLAAYSFIEHCDYLPALLTGNCLPQACFRSICAAGHKAMFSDTWGGLPEKEFLNSLDPSLGALRERLYTKAYASDTRAGFLTPEWAEKLGLSVKTSVCVGAFDAHMGGVGAGISKGILVKTLGTSTCDLMTASSEVNLEDIPGVCGIVPGSILPGDWGIEAGQSAVGDIFLWFVNNLVPDTYGKSMGEKFLNLEKKALEQKPGAHGLLALDWNNGNRTILVDPRLSGLLLGQSLYTQAHEIYRALIEATAFGALTIINRIEEYGVKVESVINCGGLAVKNSLLMQIYADVTGRPMKVSRSEQTCALGAAIFGAFSAGTEQSGYHSIRDMQKAICGIREKIYYPEAKNQSVYQRIYALYRDVHNSFGRPNETITLSHIMKELILIREEQRI